MNDKGQPEIVAAGDAQFETNRRYLEWRGGQVEGGITKIGSRRGKYVLYDRERGA